ncbi:MAG: hypothetical protein RL711_367 [Bacteroidota bacterium]|jgi:hypothetical protein
MPYFILKLHETYRMKNIYLWLCTFMMLAIEGQSQTLETMPIANRPQAISSTIVKPQQVKLPGLPFVPFFFSKHCHSIALSLGGGNYGSSVNNSVHKTGTGGQNIIDLQYEFALSNKFGIGALIEFGGLTNASLGTKFSSGMIGIKGYYHFYNTAKTTIYTSIALSRAAATVSNPASTKPVISGTGGNWQFALGLRRAIVGNWLGVHANMAFVGYELGSWKEKNKTVILKNDVNTENLGIKLNGINFTAGLTFRF